MEGEFIAIGHRGVKIWGEGKREIIGFMASVLPSNHELSLYQSISFAFLLFVPSSTGWWNELEEAVWVFGSWPGSANIAFQQQLFLDVSCCQGKMTPQLPILLSLRCNLSSLDSLVCCIFLLKSFRGEVVFNVVIVMSVDTFEKMKGKQAIIF